MLTHEGKQDRIALTYKFGYATFTCIIEPPLAQDLSSRVRSTHWAVEVNVLFKMVDL